jgi:glyoxylase-like metal-dependent hydrolase (beta-lactamase superfamily II)
MMYKLYIVVDRGPGLIIKPHRTLPIPMPSSLLPPDIRVFERGWLSSNNILLLGQDNTALVDSGYVTHAPQTLALVGSALGGRALDQLVNTHLHSDHCGGNAALQGHYPALRTAIPPGLAESVRHWDVDALTYAPTGQTCPRFRFDALLQPGTEVRLGERLWQVHAAPGHDTHSVVLFEPAARVLLSADALWERGFGVVFPELEGERAFDAVARTLDVIEALKPAVVIPGHGAVFADPAAALAYARSRLDSFVADPSRHLRHGVKVLLKFKLLELQTVDTDALLHWARSTPYFARIYQEHFSSMEFSGWVDALLDDLVRAGVASRVGAMVHNAG